MTALPPHLAVMQQMFDRMVEPTPAVVRPYSCTACRDSGDTESGRGCNWCAPQNDIPEPTEAEVERLRAVEREYMR